VGGTRWWGKEEGSNTTYENIKANRWRKQ
jgi:hypothetical protein